MSSWCLHEGSVGERAWRLSTDEELVVGRGVDCGVIVQSQSVENRHAMLKWDQRNLSYILKDLSSVNGTYVNNRPLRGTHILLKHNDAIRFGHDKDHVFRMEECFPSTPSMAESACVPMSNTMSPSHMPTTSSNAGANMHSQHIPASVQSGALSVGLPIATVQAAGITTQALSVGLPIATVQAAGITTQAQDNQSHLHSPHCHARAQIYPIDHALPAGPADRDSSPHRSDGRRSIALEHSPALNKASKLYGQPNWWGEGEDSTAARDREFEFTKPGSQILRQFDVEVVARKAPKLATKTDELRMQAISMGRPDPASSWVLDFVGGAVTATPPPRLMRACDRSSRPRSADPSPNKSTRRDPSPLAKRAATPTTKRHSSLSSSSHTSTTPISPRKQRAATPPVSRQKQRAATHPVSRQKQRAATPPVSWRAATPPVSCQKQRAATHPVSRPTGLVTGKSPLLGSPKNQVAGKSHPTTTTPQSVTSNSEPPHSDPLSPLSAGHTPLAAPIDLKSLNEGRLHHLVWEEQVVRDDEGQVVRDDETYTAATQVSSDDSFSSLSDHSPSETDPVHVVTGHGGKEGKPSPPTTRKQWGQEDTQSPDSLMMASIEARMRRLSRLTHQTARHVTTLRNSIQEGHRMQVLGLNYLSLRDTSPVVTKPEHNLPEWKFFNQEANSIFRSMRVVEKWLQDIDSTLESIQPVDHGTSAREAGAGDDIDGTLYKHIHHHSASEEEGMASNRYQCSHIDGTLTNLHPLDQSEEDTIASDGELYMDSVDDFESASED